MMKVAKTSLWILSGLLITIVGCKKTDPPINDDTDTFQQIDTYIGSLVDSADIPGISLAITNGQEIAYSKSFGLANVQTGEKLTNAHFFHVASVSKTFTATAVMQLAEKGKIDINKPLINYLPYFKMRDPRYKNITVKQMLNHTSGISDVTDYEWEKSESDAGALERYTRSLADSVLLTDPGSTYYYSNVAFDILGDLVAKVSGMSFEKYEKNYILDPLEMKGSSFYFPEMKRNLQTSPHTGNPQAVSTIYPYNRKHAPSSTLTSNIVELSHWAVANMYAGKYKNTQIINPVTFGTMTSPTVGVDPGSGLSMGLCWFIYPYKDELIYAHEGGDIGYRSILSLLPERKLGIIILSNSDNIDIQQVYFHVLDILLTAKS